MFVSWNNKIICLNARKLDSQQLHVAQQINLKLKIIRALSQVEHADPTPSPPQKLSDFYETCGMC